ncbi:hypothetical protein B7492_32170 (plasmid) [Bacillus mycoides]|uniref:Uncharacterized protein n=1 Tax=Bacillus mycoides TaxID=1405 RepID=A0A1W6AIP3_BACMY|nr:hypothetical protein [Bacillus mycoides]ARJ25692.1 hypothetical protein B7492_32170 [Bacillus mycoides]
MGKQGLKTPNKAFYKNIIQEFSQVYCIPNDYFIPLQKCRLSIMRLNELKSYIESNVFLDNVDWGNQFLKINGLNAQFQDLERKIGIQNQPSEIIGRDEIYVKYVKEHTSKEMCESIYDYLSLNAKVEERIMKIYERVNEEYLKKIENLQKSIKEVSIDSTVELVKFSSFFTSCRAKNINKVSIDSDKYITYQIKSNSENLNNLDVEIEFKIQDRSYNIQVLYNRMVHYEDSLYKLLECIINIDQKENTSKLNKRLLRLTWISVFFVITQTIIGVWGLFK